MFSDAYKDSEIREWCYDSAIDWACWPISLSQPIAPILLLFSPARYVQALFLTITAIWAFLFSYRWVSLWLATYADVIIKRSRRIIAGACAILLLSRGEYLTALLAFFWTELTIIVYLVLPVQTNRIARALYAQREKHSLR